MGLCRFEDDLEAKLMQVGIDLLKVAGGFIGEHEDKQQVVRMTGTMLFWRLLQRLGVGNNHAKNENHPEGSVRLCGFPGAQQRVSAFVLLHS